MRDNARFSVIIPSKNEAANIQECLNGVFSQLYKEYECIVVDNGSTDQTTAIVKTNNVPYIVNRDASIGELRNIGVLNSNGDFLAFLDADCAPSPEWLNNAAAGLSKPDVGAIGYTVLPTSTNWVEKTWFFNIKAKPGQAKYIGSANLIVKRKVFDDVGGFDPKLITGEDREFCWRIQNHGLKTVQDPSLAVHHFGYPKTLAQFIKREFWHGHSILSDVRNLHKSKMFFALILNIFLYIASLTCLALSPEPLKILCAPIVLALPLSVAFVKCARRHQFTNFWALTLLYFFYFAARTTALLKYILMFPIQKFLRR